MLYFVRRPFLCIISNMTWFFPRSHKTPVDICGVLSRFVWYFWNSRAMLNEVWPMVCSFIPRIYGFKVPSRDFGFQKVRGTSTTPSSKFSMAASFINVEWKLFVKLFISPWVCFCVIIKSYRQHCATPTRSCVAFVLLCFYAQTISYYATISSWQLTMLTTPM